MRVIQVDNHVDFNLFDFLLLKHVCLADLAAFQTALTPQVRIEVIYTYKSSMDVLHTSYYLSRK